MTPKQFAKKLEKVGRTLAARASEIELKAAQAVLPVMLRRQFGIGRDGSGRAVDGQLLGKYSRSYLRFRLRKNKGLNIYKNHVFSGGLRASIQSGISGGRTVIGFNNDGTAQIARFLESSPKQKINKPVYAFSPDEKQLGIEVMIRESKKITEECLRQK